jgi:hypothetical protein
MDSCRLSARRLPWPVTDSDAVVYPACWWSIECAGPSWTFAHEGPIAEWRPHKGQPCYRPGSVAVRPSRHDCGLPALQEYVGSRRYRNLVIVGNGVADRLTCKQILASRACVSRARSASSGRSGPFQRQARRAARRGTRTSRLPGASPLAVRGPALRGAIGPSLPGQW